MSAVVKRLTAAGETFRDTFANLNRQEVQYIQSELDRHSFHAIQWKHLKHKRPVP